MRGEVVQKLGVDVASQRERSLCTCVARGGTMPTATSMSVFVCAPQRQRHNGSVSNGSGIHNINTLITLHPLLPRSPKTSALPLHLTPSPSWAFVLAPSVRVATSPSHPAESGRASEWMCLRVAAASAWSEKQNGWECIVRLSFSWSAAAVSLHKILNCFHHIKAVLSYCWHMAWKAASGLFWKGENWTQRLFEVGREAFLKLNIPMTV